MKLIKQSVLLAILSCVVTQSLGEKEKWPVELNNSQVKDIYHCLYIFFICTDYVGTWPNNRPTCMRYFESCKNFVDAEEGGSSISGGSVGGATGDATASGGATTGDGAVDVGSGDGSVDTELPPTAAGGTVVETTEDLASKYETDCKSVLDGNGEARSGVYKLSIQGQVKSVFCDMETRGGGWTVIQKRGDYGRPQDYFFRNWTDYKWGFGDPAEDYWLGLEHIHYLTEGNPEGKEIQLMITLEDFDGNKTALIVNNITVGNEDSGYPIAYKNYNSKIGNSLPARGTKFSTLDRDNDAWSNNCAERFAGAWWYSACHNSNINGLYLKGQHESFGDGVNWYHWRGYHYSLKKTVMKVREKLPPPPPPPTS